ncbi:hypothetical protein VNO80_21572 [Phaseolus coccineus]|uniref:Uncharacterized protein n=1 Tax=Phaseolus coccineus TaxID=3886 RepID=A0AAN9QU69_PHACN
MKLHQLFSSFINQKDPTGLLIGCGGGSCCVESQGVVFGLWNFAIRYVMCREVCVLFNYKGFLEWWFPLFLLRR